MRSPPKLTSVTRRQRANYGRHYHFPPLSPVSVKQSTVFCMAPVCGLQTSHMPAKTVLWLLLAGAVNKVILLKKKKGEKRKKGQVLLFTYLFLWKTLWEPEEKLDEGSLSRESHIYQEPLIDVPIWIVKLWGIPFDARCPGATGQTWQYFCNMRIQVHNGTKQHFWDSHRPSSSFRGRDQGQVGTFELGL